MTKLEALKKGREIKQEKQLRAFYDTYKETITRKGAVSFEQWRERLNETIKMNPHYNKFKTKSGIRMIAAAKQSMRVKEYMSQDEIGALYVIDALKETKTGRMIKWGKKSTTTFLPTHNQRIPEMAGGFITTTQKYREETMYDVLRSKLGVGRKLELFYNEDTNSYHFIGSKGQEYQIVIDRYNHIQDIVEV